MATKSNSGNLHKSKMATGQILQNIVLEKCVITLFMGIRYVESTSDVKFSVQSHDQMLKVR